MSQGEHRRRLLIARSIADREGLPLESVDLREIGQAAPMAEDVIGRLENALISTLYRMPPDEVDDPDAFRGAAKILLAETARTARKLDADPQADLTLGDLEIIEAVIRTDGTRPSLPVRNDAVDPQHPLAGRWCDNIADTQDALRNPLRAVGRVEPVNATAHSFFGTGWVVDHEAGLVLTNLHVVESMWHTLRHLMERTDNGFRLFGDAAFVDFAGESGSTRINRWRVVEGTPSPVDGPKLARLDVAVLKVEPTSDAEDDLPKAIPVVPDSDGPRGNLGSFCVVGFPAPPRFTTGVHQGVNWNWVTSTLFGNRFGVKRLAPGIVHRPLGSVPEDHRHWVFGHDATTLGGNSGSPLVSWLDPQPGSFGLHFGGMNVDTNLAHAVAACGEHLRALGVPITLQP
jgi:hypothetical protein